jgi:hypothetical protein
VRGDSEEKEKWGERIALPCGLDYPVKPSFADGYKDFNDKSSATMKHRHLLKTLTKSTRGALIV